MVAFHFQFANQAGWKCDVCRRSGLEIRRRCRWLGLEEDTLGPPVWARSRVAIGACPKSFITTESMALVEEFAARRRMGAIDVAELTARQADAFLMLEAEIAKERRRGTQNTRAIT